MGEATDKHSAARSADRASGIVLALLMSIAFILVIKQVVNIATGPVPPRTGAPSRPIAGLTPQGASIALADLKDRVVLVDFWATWCPPCVAAMPSLEALHQKFGARGLTVLGVN